MMEWSEGVKECWSIEVREGGSEAPSPLPSLLFPLFSVNANRRAIGAAERSKEELHLCVLHNSAANFSLPAKR